jgi:hypothetical protein
VGRVADHWPDWEVIGLDHSPDQEGSGGGMATPYKFEMLPVFVLLESPRRGDSDDI